MSPEQKDEDRRITYFAATHTRGKREMFGIRAIDRGKHVYVIGKTGMGKSTLLENMAIQDIQNGEGICFIDPHGSTAEKLLDFVPFERINDVVYFAPFDTENPIGFNVMEDVGYDKRHLVVSGLMGALKRIWVDAWSARMEYILQNTLLALLEYPDSTLLDVNKMLTNKVFRVAVVEKITDPIVRAFWTEEFAAFTDTYTREATPAIQNKVGQFTSNPLIRNIIGQPKSSFDLRKIMDEKKIFIVNLSKGRMGETNASLLGSMLTVKIYLAAMSRADEPAMVLAKLPRCYFYVDEFQSMMNEAFADILSESRKYKLALTLANQYIEQMEEEVRDAVFGNVGTTICFRVGPFDAEVLKVMFEPTFTPEDLIGLGIGQVYLTLMIDGVTSPPFSAQTIPPIEAPRISYRDDVVTHSRAMFGRPRVDVETVINKKQTDFAQPPKKDKPKSFPGAGGSGAPYRDTSVSPRDQMQGAFVRHSATTPPGGGHASVPRSQAPSFTSHTTSRPTPPPRRFDAPRFDTRQESADPRNALKAAINTARMTAPPPVSGIAPPPLAVTTRSPADILREKHAARLAKERERQAEKTQNPQPPPPRPPHVPTGRHNEAHEDSRREPVESAPLRPEQPGEVSRELLERVLNGHQE
ncbi:MAG TPA: type IV secretion system DNA-binding domain-containing protein [Candidatus Paceibacterota bacterium]